MRLPSCAVLESSSVRALAFAPPRPFGLRDGGPLGYHSACVESVNGQCLLARNVRAPPRTVSETVRPGATTPPVTEVRQLCSDRASVRRRTISNLRHVSRSWAELLGDAEGPQETEEQRAGFFGRLRESLGKSRRALTSELASATFDPGNEEHWERLEEALIHGDVGVRATAELVRRLEARGDLGELGEALAQEVAEMLGEPGKLNLGAKPTVILVVGVNGTGKTTTIGKLAQKLREHDRSVLLGAADTFRAAAEEQLEIWAERAGADFVGAARGADPAAVAFDAVEAARARGHDVAIVDTAGRLHTQSNLMEELAKVRRVIEGRLEGAPHETLLVVDATTGQNGLQQARLFGEAANVTGVALTKLDGSAKGGIAVAIAYELGLPVKLIGVGEGLDDLRPFDPQDFARALVSG